MSKKEVPMYITKDLQSTIGGGESEKMYVIVSVADGKAEVVVEKTITQRYPIQDLAKATDLYERLTCGSGRKLWQLEELAHPYNPN